MHSPSRSPSPRNAIAWALLSQAVWLPLLAIDLHDRWQAQWREQQELIAAAKAPAQLRAQDRSHPTLASGVPHSRGAAAPATTGLLLGSTSQAIHGLADASASLVESARGVEIPLHATPRFSAGPKGRSLDKPRQEASAVTIDRQSDGQGATQQSPRQTPAIAFRNPWIQSFNRAELLGGNLGLGDLNTTMPPLALAERARWSNSGDPLAPLPSPWREPMRQALHNLSSGSGNKPRITASRIVHVPSIRVRQPTTVPLAVQPDGSVDILANPDNPAVVDEIRRWSARQTPSGTGVTAAVVHLEPIPDAPPVIRPAASIHSAGRSATSESSDLQRPSPRSVATLPHQSVVHPVSDSTPMSRSVPAPGAVSPPAPAARSAPAPVAGPASTPVVSSVTPPSPPLPAASAPVAAPTTPASTPAAPPQVSAADVPAAPAAGAAVIP